MILCYGYSSQAGYDYDTTLYYGMYRDNGSASHWLAVLWDGLEATSPPIPQQLREEDAMYGSGEMQIAVMRRLKAPATSVVVQLQAIYENVHSPTCV